MKVIVNRQQNKTVSVNTQGTTEVVSVGILGPVGPRGAAGPPGPNVISSAEDVDTTILNNGSVLVYKTNTNKWTSTTTLDAQNMDGGEF